MFREGNAALFMSTAHIAMKFANFFSGSKNVPVSLLKIKID
jgi:hypothetical protein